MRALTGLVLLGVASFVTPSLAAPTPARRAQSPICPPGSGVVADQQLTRLSGAAQAAAQEVLGTQFVMLWLGADGQSLSIGFSPGALDATAAQAAFAQRVAALGPEDAAYLPPRVVFAPTPYSRAQLEAVAQDLLVRRAEMPELNGFGLGCSGDAVRVQVLAGRDTPEYRARLEAFLGPHAPFVNVTYGFGEWQAAVGKVPAAPLPARSYVRLPSTKRCIRGPLVVKPRRPVVSVHLQAGKRSVQATDGKPARLKLTARRTKVKVSVAVAEGVAEQTLTYRRCATPRR